MNKIILGDNATVLPTLPNNFARLIYIDPPFNTGKVQKNGRSVVKLTDVQFKQLQKLRVEPQPAHGKSIGRVHTNLEKLGLVFYSLRKYFISSKGLETLVAVEKKKQEWADFKAACKKADET